MKTAVISGGGRGLGLALARALQDRGWRAVILDRDVSGVSASDTEVPFEIDLTDAANRGKVFDEVLAKYPAVDLAVYNAGVTHIGPLSELSDAAHRKLFEINYFVAVEMARALVPAVRGAKGTHLAISSVAGFSPLYHRTGYAASKHAMEGFFKSLRSEEAPHSVRTVIAAPSFVATNIGQPERQSDGLARPGSATDGIDEMSAEAAVAEILKGLDRGRAMIPVGRVARMAWRVNRLSPGLFQHLMERNIRPK